MSTATRPPRHRGRLDASMRPGGAKLRVDMTNCVGSEVHRVPESPEAIVRLSQGSGRRPQLLPAACGRPLTQQHLHRERHSMLTDKHSAGAVVYLPVTPTTGMQPQPSAQLMLVHQYTGMWFIRMYILGHSHHFTLWLNSSGGHSQLFTRE